ncbi:hypothetical protein RND81_08G028400 [Saponaria officinalis]|uniref:Stress-response A/B barrel domain-containing protein n=1 Tax=Saponaria officinalis TaxID=3572 RepID=A0AAW1J2J7_SAPOF
MLCTTVRPIITIPQITTRHQLLRRINHRRRSLSTVMSSTVEHIVLFNVKPTAESTQLAAMVDGLNGLRSMDMVLHLSSGPLLRNRSSSLHFTHILHSRYRTKEDLATYSAHDAHLSVVRSSVLPICDDIMAVDWVAEHLEGPAEVKPGSALRVQFVKLKDGLGDKEKEDVFGVIGGLKDKFDGIEQISFGENFSPARAKGFSLASIGVFGSVKELDALDGNVRMTEEKNKVRDYIDSLVVADYIVPSTQSASL